MLLDLLHELQEKVWSYCSFEDLKNLSLVCRSLNRSLHPHLFNKLRPPTDVLEDGFIDNLVAKVPHTQHLIIWGGEMTEATCRALCLFTHLRRCVVHGIDITDENFRTFCTSLSASLRELYLPNTCELSDTALVHLAELSSLAVLGLTFSKNTTDVAMSHVAGVASLRKLDLSLCNRITDEGVACLASLTNLEELVLVCCQGIDGSGFTSLVALPKFHKLNVSYSHVNAEGFREISQLPHLSFLNVFGCPLLDDDGFTYITQLTSLKKIGIACYENTLNEHVFTSVTRLVNLEEVIVDGDWTTQGMLGNIASLPRLRRLDLWDINHDEYDLSVFRSDVEIVQSAEDGTCSGKFFS